MFFGAIILFFLFVLAFISPKRFLPGESPKRRGAILLYLLPSFVLFIAFGSIYESKADSYLKDPTTTYINLNSEGLKELPKGYEVFTQLTDLDLSANKFDHIPEVVLGYTQLETLDLTENQVSVLPEGLGRLTQLKTLALAENPIETLPEWLGSLTNLEKVTLSRTNITSLPAAWQARVADSSLTIDYYGTPLYYAEHPEEMPAEEPLAEATDDPKPESGDLKGDEHTESFGEYAWRNLLGKDYGQRRKYGEGEIYYDQPATAADADSLGFFLIDMEFFTEDRESTIQLVCNKERTRYGVLMVTVYDDADEVEEDIKSACRFYALLFAAKMGEDIAVDWHICDDRLDILATVSTDELEEGEE